MPDIVVTLLQHSASMVAKQSDTCKPDVELPHHCSVKQEVTIGQCSQAAHAEPAAGPKLHRQRDLLALHSDDRLVDGHVPEVNGKLAEGPVQAVRERLPRGHHVAGRRHEHAPVDAVVAQEPVVPACAWACNKTLSKTLHAW